MFILSQGFALRGTSSPITSRAVIDCWYDPSDLHNDIVGTPLTRDEAVSRGLPPDSQYAFSNYIPNKVCNKCGMRADAHFMKGAHPCLNCVFGKRPELAESTPGWCSVRCTECNCVEEECSCEEFKGFTLRIGAAMDISTPIIDDVFKTQEVDDEALRWLYAMVGRIFTRCGKFDNWGTGLMIW